MIHWAYLASQWRALAVDKTIRFASALSRQFPSVEARTTRYTRQVPSIEAREIVTLVSFSAALHSAPFASTQARIKQARADFNALLRPDYPDPHRYSDSEARRA